MAKDKPAAAGTVTIDPDVIRLDVDTPEAVPAQRYHLGVTDDCPFDVLYASGEDFPRNNQQVSVSKSGETTRVPVHGRVVPLTEKKVKAVLKWIQNKVIRRIGSSAQKLDRRSSRYNYRVGDVPMACYLYMRKVSDQMPAEWRSGPGPRMAELPKPQTETEPADLHAAG